MSVTIDMQPEVEVRLEGTDYEDEPIEFNWLQLQGCHSTVTGLLNGLGVKADGECYSVKVDDLIDGLAKWDGIGFDNGMMQYKQADYQNRMILKLGMMAMGCKMKGIEEITWG
jgi:hypothetical protein